MSLGKLLSITAGLITVFALTYSGLAPIWDLPLATEIDQTAKVFVVMLSGILSAFTGQKIRTEASLKSFENDAQILEEENKKFREDGLFKGIVSAQAIDATIPEEVTTEHAEFEETGARGFVYNVPINTYSAFKKAVNGNSYDIDNHYGAQCWDGAALLWQQLGKTLSTGGTGAAKGTWTHARTHNLGNDFVAVGRSNLRIGDVVVFDGLTYGHIGFVDKINDNDTIDVLGQNQVGNGNGAPFNVITMRTTSILGAFSFKNWRHETTTPTPQASKTITETLINDVISGKYGNGEVRKTALKNAGYNPSEVQNEVNAKLSTQKTATIKKIRVGSRVRTSAIKDQNGTYLNLKVLNDGNSYYTGTNSRGFAVLSTKNNRVRAAVAPQTLTEI